MSRFHSTLTQRYNLIFVMKKKIPDCFIQIKLFYDSAIAREQYFNIRYKTDRWREGVTLAFWGGVAPAVGFFHRRRAGGARYTLRKLSQ